ncbi:MAG: transcription termination/antitermination protein NusA [Solobacterium sp.]|nr:transcription termination/antitermination protein NusA [Solobacterium sp.]
MKLNYKDMIKALADIEDERRVSEEVVISALKEAMCKAYKKDIDISDINVEAEINDKTSTIDIYQLYNVVEEVEDDELEMELEDALEYDPNAQIGSVVRRQVEITEMSRAAATLARNVIRQKIREAEKTAVYDEYIDQLHEMVIGIVESVKEKFTLVNLGKTVAMMPKSSQIPQERLTEGQKIRVVITEVNKDGKGSQVLVSRADPMLVKRLFEKEVPEIFQGIVEIKAIARDAGDRTKMAVMTHNDEIDPIGACIGQRGTRVQEIIDELRGEKIDIFLWNEDVTQLVRNALAPAEIEAVLPQADGSILAVVGNDQLSLAIGKKGKNAKLAVKLCGRRIDIKTRENLMDEGRDYDQLVAEAEIRKIEIQKEIERKKAEKLAREAREAEEKRLQAMAMIAQQKAERGEEEESDELIPEEMQEHVKERIRTEMAMQPEEKEETPEEQPEEITAEPAAEIVTEEPEPEVEEEPEETPEEEPEEETVAEVKEPAKPKSRKIDLEEVAKRNDYVSQFEKLASVSKPKEQEKSRKKKRKNDDEDIKVRNAVLEQQLRKDLTNENMRPVYTEEELEEIERREWEEEESQYDIDYDEYEDYYDEDNK